MDVARGGIWSKKGRAKMVVVETHLKERRPWERTQVLNGLRGHLTEVGVIATQGPRHAHEMAHLIEALRRDNSMGPLN